MRKLLFVLLFLITTPLSANAVGGDGATCNPSTPNWGSCTLADVPMRANVSNTINIPGGNYSSPYLVTTPNTEYILQGDMVFDGSGFDLRANNVVINLNGHTVTYNQTTPGQGFYASDYFRANVAIVNGSIVQGAAASEGNLAGYGNNAIVSWDGSGWYDLGTVHLANLYISVIGRDISAVQLGARDSATVVNPVLVEQVTVEDKYFPGTTKDRHNVKTAIMAAAGSTVRDCTVINARQVGISGYASQLYRNHITVRSIDTNSSGLSCQTNSNCYSNTIIARGVHPIGIYAGWYASNANVYDNYVDVEKTMFGGDGSGDHAAGIRMSFGSNNFHVYDNVVRLRTHALYNGINAGTGLPVQVEAPGKGIFAGILEGETALVEHNIVTVTGDGMGSGMSPSHGGYQGMYFVGNTILAEHQNITISDGYGGSVGYPLFANNRLIKLGSRSDYTPIGTYGGWGQKEVRFVGTIYENGAAFSNAYLDPSGGEPGVTHLSVYFGTFSGGTYTYNYRLHDNNQTSSTVLTETFSPATTLAFTAPTTLATPYICDANHPMICITEPTCTTAGGTWTGTECVGDVTVVTPTTTCYQDADNDLYGNGVSEAVKSTCSSGYYSSTHFTSLTGDCNDSNSAIHPGAADVCPADGIDQDCSGADYTNCSVSSGGTGRMGTGSARLKSGGGRMQ